MTHGCSNSAVRRGAVGYPRDHPDFSDDSSFIDDFNDHSDFEDDPRARPRSDFLSGSHGAQGGYGMEPFDDYDEREGHRSDFNPRHGGRGDIGFLDLDDDLCKGDHDGIYSGHGGRDGTGSRGSGMRGPPRVPGVRHQHADFGGHGVSPMQGRHIPQRPPTLPLAFAGGDTPQRRRSHRPTFAGEDEDFGLGSGAELAGHPRGGRPDRFGDSREDRRVGGRMGGQSSDMHGDMHGGSRYDMHGGRIEFLGGGGQGRRSFGGREGRYGSYH